MKIFRLSALELLINHKITLRTTVYLLHTDIHAHRYLKMFVFFLWNSCAFLAKNNENWRRKSVIKLHQQFEAVNKQAALTMTTT